MEILIKILDRFLHIETGRLVEVEEEVEGEGIDEPPTQLQYPLNEQAPPIGFRTLGEYGEVDPEVR